VGRDPGVAVERGLYDFFSCSFSSAPGWSGEALSVACLGSVVGAVGAAAARSAASFPFPGAVALSGAGLFGGDPVCAVHGHALAAGALPRARPAQRRDLPAAPGGVGAAGLVGAGAAGAAGAVGGGGQARLVARDRRRLARGGEKGGEKVARTLLGRPGSRYHLAVDANGAPLAVRLAPGNENERRHLLPLLDTLAGQGIEPAQLWADRGYASARLEQTLRARGIEPRISKPRRAGAPIPAGTATREVWRGKKRRLRTPDPHARQRWPVERTNAWLKAKRRIATRRDRKADNYLAFLHLGMILILAKPL
jgi:transposase